MSLKDAIARNQRRQARFKKYERILRRVRQRVFDYEDAGKLDKAQNIMRRCQAILAPKWEAERVAAQDRKLQRTPSAFEPGSV